ncbi:hypothetical protein JTM68_31960, partial [Pseudomonas aeruginosa]|nr:hypothetical protein [Pseudomonas aeruginosa]
EPQAGGREVQAATVARKTLAYDFFRILRAPLGEGFVGNNDVFDMVFEGLLHYVLLEWFE